MGKPDTIGEQREYEHQSKKLALFNILDILRKYSDENHRLSQKEIEERLLKEYAMKIDRKTIKASLMSLEEFGYDLEYSEVMRPHNKKTGNLEKNIITSDYFLRKDIEDSELRLLIDSVLFSKHISYNQCRDLIGKLEKLSTVYFKSRVKHIATMPHDRTNNQQLFLTIDILDEAISQGDKVCFKYMEYNTDLSQTAKKSASGEERIYVVSPYQMVAKEGKYYLICNYDCYDDISNYRVDRMMDVEILDEKAKPFEKLKGSDGQRLDLARYMNEHVYMYSGNTIRVKLRIIRPMISDIIDMFGTNVRFMDQTEEAVTVQVNANETAVVQFAKNYAPDVLVLGPVKVRQRVIDMLKEGLEGYE